MNYCGIDSANKASRVCIMDGAQRVLSECAVSTEEAALREALSGLGRLRVAIEAQPLAEWLSGVVERCGHEAVLIDARAAKHLLCSKKKTDRRDARTLAQMARTEWYTAVHRKSSEARLMRSRLQARSGLVRTAKRMNSEVRGLLRAHGVRVGRVSDAQFAERVRALAHEQVPGLVAYLEPLLELWESARTQAKALKKAIAREGHADAVVRQLKSVPAVGPLVSQAYVATIDDPHRFARGEQAADYAGLCSRVYQSGESEYHGRITKEGDKLLRWHLVEAAHVLLSHGPDCALKRWGVRLAQRKGHAKAKVAVARKLAVLLWRLWVTGEEFDPQRGLAAA